MRLLRLLTRPRWGSVSPALALALVLVSCTSSSPVETPLAVDRLMFLTAPSGVVAGQAFNPGGGVRVAIVDPQNNTVPLNNVDITLYLDSVDPRDTLLGIVTSPTVAGVSSFTNLSLKRATGGFRLVAVSRGLTGAMSPTFAVSVGPAAKLAFAVQPTPVIAGEKMIPAPQVVVQDAVGNLIPNDSGQVIVNALFPSGVTPRNNAVNVVNGVAKFDSLRINVASPLFSLQANAPPSRGLQPATSNVFAVSAGAASKLAWTQQAANIGKNIVFSPPLTVAVADSMGNIVTSFTRDVTIDIDPPTNATSAVLIGTKTVACVSGVATFPGISVDRATLSSIRLRAYHATLGDTARGAFFQVF